MGSSDIKLIERLRNENLEQFFTLVRMHLSFVVDINSDEVDCSADKPKQFRWNFHKKIKTSSSYSSQNTTNNTKKVEEASSITEDGILRLYELIDFLSQKDNVIQEGIFRRTGSLTRQQELRQLLVTGSSLGLEDSKFSVHDCASVLKGFLAELPQPLLMDQYYQTYCTLASQYPPNAESSEEKLLTALQLLLLLLAPSHRNFLERLLSLLRLVADNEASNRMSPDTLATMFTPHLLCPRKLSPETFHAESIAVSPLVSFMIRQSARLFVAPPRLATDAAAYFTKRSASPHLGLDESITDRTTANTVYTFVDRHRTRAENESNPTDTALAQLCAHIQGLPDSQHKRRLVKQFNRQNGYGTPIQIQRTGKIAGSRSFGDSIKRHIFNKGLLNKTPKKGSGSTINVIEEKSNKTKRFTDNSKVDVSHKNIVLKNLANKIASTESLDDDYESDASDESTLSEGALNGSTKMSPKFVSEPNLSSLEANEETPKKSKARSRLFRSRITANNRKYRKHGAIARTTPTCVSCVREQHSDDDTHATREHQLTTDEIELKMHYSTSTPGHTHAHAHAHTQARADDADTPYHAHFRRASMSPITKSTQKLSKAMQESIMTPRSRKPLIITSEQTNAQEADKVYESMSPKNDSDFVSSDDDGSTFSFERSSHSSNTRPASVSAASPPRHGPPANQHTHLHTANQHTHLHTTSQHTHLHTTNQHTHLHTTLGHSDVALRTSFDDSLYKTKSLTEPFREYLISRSVLTATPVDLSILNKSDADDKISDSLMFCLDGNVPTDLTSSVSNLELSPETFHAESIAVSPLVSFMIRQSARLFVAPPRLATDAAAYFTKRSASPHLGLDESITDRTTANTVYTFVDRHRTRAENESNPTDTALAQLCAHIQGLPDSQHKRRLVKQFNRQNGYGTPIQIQRTGKIAGSRSFGDSIKRHIFNKGLLNKTPKKGSGSTINVIEEKSNKTKRFTDNSKVDVSHKNIVLKNLANKIASTESLDDDYESDASDESTLSEGALNGSTKMSPKFVSEPNLSSLEANEETPKKSKARSRLFRSRITANNRKYRKHGAIARTTPTCVSCVREQHSDDDTHATREHQLTTDEIELKMHYSTSTPGHTHAHAHAHTQARADDADTPYHAHFRRASMSPITKSTQKLSKAMQESIMTPRSRKPLIITSEQTNAQEADKVYESMSPKNDSDFVSSDDDGSTFSFERSSHSSNTRPASVSAASPPRHGPPANQHTHLHTANQHTHLHTTSQHTHLHTTNQHTHLHTTLGHSDVALRTSFDDSLYKTKSLTEPFREYLISRSVLTATPVDLSILNKSDADDKISDSLMFCLDGNVPTDLTSSVSNLEVGSSIDRSLKCNVNIELSPSRKRCVASCGSTDGKKAMADKENINHYELRETDL